MALAKWIQMQKNLKSKKNKPYSKYKHSLKEYAKYSNIAFKMGAIIFLGAYGGFKLDEYFSVEKHIITLILTLLSVVLAMYVVIKDVLKK